MRRRKILWWTVFGLLAVIMAGVTLVSLVYHEPAFYQRACLPPGDDRHTQARQLVFRLGELYDRFKDDGSYHRRTGDWNYTFSAEQINSYFEEDFQRGKWAVQMEKHGISSPRLSIDSERLRLAFRYGSGWWSSVISVDFRIWLVPKEVNVVGLEILARRAGALPISAQFFLDNLTDVARNNRIDITWYRHNGNPVALLRFQSDRTRPTAQLRRLELRPGRLTLYGAPLEVVQQALGRLAGRELKID